MPKPSETLPMKWAKANRALYCELDFRRENFTFETPGLLSNKLYQRFRQKTINKISQLIRDNVPSRVDDFPNVSGGKSIDTIAKFAEYILRIRVAAMSGNNTEYEGAEIQYPPAAERFADLLERYLNKDIREEDHGFLNWPSFAVRWPFELTSEDIDAYTTGNDQEKRRLFTVAVNQGVDRMTLSYLREVFLEDDLEDINPQWDMDDEDAVQLMFRISDHVFVEINNANTIDHMRSMSMDSSIAKELEHTNDRIRELEERHEEYDECCRDSAAEISRLVQELSASKAGEQEKCNAIDEMARRMSRLEKELEEAKKQAAEAQYRLEEYRKIENEIENDTDVPEMSDDVSIDNNLRITVVYSFDDLDRKQQKQKISKKYPNARFLTHTEKIDPAGTDLVLFMASYMEHSLYQPVRAQCKRDSIPYLHVNGYTPGAIERTLVSARQKRERRQKDGK